jgi:NodT family efflux transporter outer membrane factor (OMF) lipoprotein
LFGSLRRRREAAVDDARAAEVSQAAVRIAISAEAADAYLGLRGLQAQLRLADLQEITQSHLIELVQMRVGQGVSSDRELQRALGELERVRALKPMLRAGIDAEIYRLDILMGTPAGTHHDELAIEAIQPSPPHPAGSITPADLMQRRPDIVIAERHLAAANARIGLAVAEYYPHVTFNGLLGFESVDSGSLFTSPAQQSGALIGLRWRLFDFGRVDAEVAIARGREQEALAVYRGTVLHATEDVEAALSQFIQSRSEAETLERQITALTRAREEAQTAYEGGVLPLIEVLDADRDLLDAKDRLAAANANEARAAVASFRALGGGWTG